jgi:RHH-type proline utilization regulon transcriptional repressor/proline dehydrogenase/delta 1-pyrroline-5-carboxylate dehydrogenase
LAIFTGQVAAALAAGNAVIAKPARATPLIGMRAVRLLHEAGVPTEALQFLPGSGAVVGEVVLKDRRIDGVAFTGSTDTAAWIQQALAARGGPIVPLIAETGGLNVMIADSTALPEQVVLDAMQSAFNSAGQRCSALRVLFVQNDVAERVIKLLREAMGELVIGNPRELATDVGPVIDADACRALSQHVQQLAGVARELRTLELPPTTASGTFFAPRAYEIDSLDVLQREVFGPVLHVVRYAGDRLDAVVDAVNRSGYGLTLGIHSRIAATAQRIAARARVGNIYVNRNMIGAVVGVQPFGGEGLSGTGPKAGGPHYLHRFATERTLTINTAAVGGNTTLVSLREES